MHIKELATKAHALAVVKGWYDKGRPPIPERIALIHSELSEALEENRKGYPPNFIYVHEGKPEGFGIELADAIIRLVDLCEAEGVDIEQAIEIKMSYNATRPQMHGGKKF